MGLESRHDASLGCEPLEAFRGKFDRWLQGATLAIALVAGGCGNGAETPEKQCSESPEIVAAGINYGECNKLAPKLVKACREKFSMVIELTQEGCLMLNTQKDMNCHPFSGGRTPEQVPRFNCGAVLDAQP